LRQAYDYWQNQPGNYRSPRLATSAFYGAGEISYWRASRRTRLTAASGFPSTAAWHNAFPSLRSPELLASGRCAPRGGFSAPTPPLRRLRRTIDPLMLCKMLAIGQQSTEPNSTAAASAHLSTKAPATAHPWYAVPPEQSASQGSTGAMLDPIKGSRQLLDRPLGFPRNPHTTSVSSDKVLKREARRLLQTRIRHLHADPGCPSHIPTELFVEGNPPHRVRACTFFFRKIHYYGIL
jgi:hypothetical protein